MNYTMKRNYWPAHICIWLNEYFLLHGQLGIVLAKKGWGWWFSLILFLTTIVPCQILRCNLFVNILERNPLLQGLLSFVSSVSSALVSSVLHEIYLRYVFHNINDVSRIRRVAASHRKSEFELCIYCRSWLACRDVKSMNDSCCGLNIKCPHVLNAQSPIQIHSELCGVFRSWGLPNNLGHWNWPGEHGSLALGSDHLCLLVCQEERCHGHHELHHIFLTMMCWNSSDTLSQTNLSPFSFSCQNLFVTSMEDQ